MVYNYKIMPQENNKLSNILFFSFIGLLSVGLVYFLNRPNSQSIGGQQKEVVAENETVVQNDEVQENMQETVAELKIEDIKVGDGAVATSGKTVSVHYTGTLTDGTKFDSSKDRGTPFEFNLGAGQVIAGWDKGVVGMKVGGVRKLTIPSDMAYGPNGIPGVIPGGATLIFEVELLGVK